MEKRMPYRAGGPDSILPEGPSSQYLRFLVHTTIPIGYLEPLALGLEVKTRPTCYTTQMGTFRPCLQGGCDSATLDDLRH